MKTARKPAKGTHNLPFEVPEKLESALKNAAEKVEAVAAETRSVAAKVEARVRTAATNVKKTGQSIARDPKGFVDGVVHDAKALPKRFKGDVEKVRTDVSREATRIAEEVAHRISGAIEPALEKTLHRLNVPTQKELRNLATKVDALSRKIDALHTPKPRAPRKPRVAAQA